MDNNIQLIWKLWEVANYITGFSAIQSIAFAFAVINQVFLEKLRTSFPLMIFVFTAILFGGIMYFVGVRWCHIKSMKIFTSQENFEENKKEYIQFLNIWKTATVGRFVAIIFFTTFILFLIFGIKFGIWIENPAQNI